MVPDRYLNMAAQLTGSVALSSPGTALRAEAAADLQAITAIAAMPTRVQLSQPHLVLELRALRAQQAALQAPLSAANMVATTFNRRYACLAPQAETAALPSGSQPAALLTTGHLPLAQLQGSAASASTVDAAAVKVGAEATAAAPGEPDETKTKRQRQ